MRLILYAVLIVVGWKMLLGRWPWEPARSLRAEAQGRARRLLGLREDARREDIIAAHKRLLTRVHPDRGGSNAQVHEANAARDLLLDGLQPDTKEL
ncbi:MAG: hypothetical protein RLZZ08_1579 [Pseudomonadota bacterium]